VLEYESGLKRDCRELGLTEQGCGRSLGRNLFTGRVAPIVFPLERPVASDPNDDLMLEAAIASRSDFIITFNRRDFPESPKFGIRCLTLKEVFLLLRELP
jgi:hypothetical protein